MPHVVHVGLQGGVEFTVDGDHTVITTKAKIKVLCDLLSVTEEDLTTALCSRVIAARGEAINKVHTVTEAVYGRDALAKVSSF